MFWENFVTLCKSRNVTPNSVAAELGLSNATCTKWKKGAVPGGKNLQMIAEYFGVATDNLIGSDARTPEEGVVLALIARLPDLSESEKDTLSQLLSAPADRRGRALEMVRLFLGNQ